MSIIVAITAKQTATDKGDLLEDLAKKLLESHNYEVTDKVNVTGAEFDLVCQNKANRSKEIYVECKAREDRNKVHSDVIAQLVGNKNIHNYEEAWLVSASDAGKDAKGLIDKIEHGPLSRSFTFYTPDRLIDALVDANLIKSAVLARTKIIDMLKSEDKVGEAKLLVSPYGYYWVIEYLSAGQAKGVLFLNTSDCKLISDEELLSNLASLKAPFQDLEFIRLNAVDNSDAAAEAQPILNVRLGHEYIELMNDLGTKFGHPAKDDLKLDDVFIYPDLQEVNSTDDNKSMSSRSLTEDKGIRRFMIFGEDLSGKTSLARTLQKSLCGQNQVALYISAEEVKQSSFDKFSILLIKKFKGQYSDDPGQVAAFEKTLSEHSKKISIIIDDFELLGIKRSGAEISFFEMIKEKFSGILLFANKSVELEVMARAETRAILSDFRVYRVMQLGHLRRDDLIEKWISVENGDTLTDSHVLNKKIELSKKINTAVGTNFVPTYPFYLLTMLHLLETGGKSKLQVNSYAELYGYLITHSLLSANAKPEDLDFYTTYLSYIAHYFFTHNIRSLDEAEMREMFKGYCSLMDLEKSFNVVHKLLKNSKLIREEDGSYSFYFNYCHYYFTAKYLSDNIEKEEIKITINNLIKDLHKNEYANMVIFLIHHSKNKGLVDAIMEKTKTLFSEMEPATLSKEELTNVNGLLQEEIKHSFRDSNPSENRKKDLAARDKLEADQKKDEEKADKEDLDLFDRVNLAFKIMEVLGQVANNYYGSLEGESKASIIEEMYLLGLRGLHVFLNDTDEYIQAIRQDFDKLLEEQDRELTEEVQRTINKTVFLFTEFIVIIFLKRISENVTSANLFTTTSKVAGRHKILATELIDTAVHLNFPNELIRNKSNITNLYKKYEKNYLTRDILRFFAVYHMYKFEVGYKEKQSICTKLDVDFLPATNQLVLPKEKNK